LETRKRTRKEEGRTCRDLSLNDTEILDSFRDISDVLIVDDVHVRSREVVLPIGEGLDLLEHHVEDVESEGKEGGAG